MFIRYRLLLVVPALMLASCASQPPVTGGHDTNFTIEQLKQNAEMASYAGAYSDALSQYQKILEKDPDNVPALIGVGESLLAAVQPARAEVYLQRALKLDPVNVDAREARALSWLMQGDSAAAKRSLDNLIDDGVDRWRVWNALGMVADLSSDYSAALEHYQKAMVLEPERAILHNNMGYSLVMAHDYVAAERSLKRALLLEPGNDRVLNNLALCVAWQGRYSEAINLLTPVMGAAAATNNIGYIAYLRKEYPEAKEFFTTAMRLSPKFYIKASNNLDLVNQKLALE